MYEKEIIQRKEEIFKKIKIQKEKIKNKKNKRIKISILNKTQKKTLNDKKDLKKYNGDETFFIEQSNPNGELLDYAVLYGKKNEKIFLGFQIKCYSMDTTLDKKFLSRFKIKQALSPILFNSIKLFNCLIKEWHYFLIFYNNKEDDISLNVGYSTLLSSYKNNIEYLLYDPNKKEFNKKLKLSDLSNLDNISYLNNPFNYVSLPPYFFEEINYDKFIKNYHIGLSQFIKDFINYSKEPKKILNILSEKLKIKDLLFCLSVNFCQLELPIVNYLFLYKKKESSYFIAFVNNIGFEIYDLESEKTIHLNEGNKLINFEYKYTYILKFKGKSTKRKGIDDDSDIFNEYKDMFEKTKIK